MTIYLEHVTKAFDGRNVLNDFTLTVEDGKYYALIGPEGAGKTTVLKIFMGLIQPDAGKVTRLGDYKYPTLVSSYMSQDGQLEPKKNAIWNVKKVHFRVTKGRAIEDLSLFLDKDRLKLPVMQLTEKERRFVEFVRALSIPSDFIVLDEPFLGMNEEDRKKITDYLFHAVGTRPILMASRSETGMEFARKIHL